MSNAASEALADRIAGARHGWTWFSFESRSSHDATHAVRDTLSRVGLDTPESGLWTITREGAEEFLRGILFRDLAYDRDQMPTDVAAAMARDFIGLFLPDAEYLTNWPDHRAHWPDAGSWDPVTTHTFDAVLVGLDRDNAGLVCVADED